MSRELVSPDDLTSPERNRPVVGVWLMIITPDSKLFVVENLKSKFISQKLPGQINCPAETYKPEDTSLRGTIQRTILEEVGQLNFDPSRVAPLGLNKLNIPGQNVVAAPYLIPIANTHDLTYDPQDPTEATNPHWLDLSSINPNVLLKIGEYEVPYFRTPMVEIIAMLKRYQARGIVQIHHSSVPPIPSEVFEYLEANPGTRAIAYQAVQ